MTFEWGMVTAIVAALGAALAIIKYWFDAATLAKTALQAAGEARELALREVAEVRALAKEAHDRIGLLMATISAHREMDAKELVSRATLQQVEDRLAGAIERLGDRFDSILQELVTSNNQRGQHGGTR